MTVKRLWLSIIAFGILTLGYPVQSQSSDQSILSIAYSPDGSMVAISGTQGYFEIKDPKLQQTLFTISTLTSQWIASLVWSPDSERIAGVTQGNLIKVWNVKDNAHAQGELLASLTGFNGFIGDLIWTPDGATIVGASANDSDVKNFKGWNANSYQLQFESSGPNYVNSVSWSPDNTHVAIAAEGGFGITDPADIISGTINNVTILSYYPIQSTHWSRTSRYLAYVSGEGTVTLYDVAAGTSVVIPNAILAGGTALFAWGSNDKSLAVFGTRFNDGTVKVWDPTSGDLLSSRQTNYVLPASGLDWSPDGNYLAYTSDPTTLAIEPPYRSSDLKARIEACITDARLKSTLNQQVNSAKWDAILSTVKVESSISASCKSQLSAMTNTLKATSPH